MSLLLLGFMHSVFPPLHAYMDVFLTYIRETPGKDSQSLQKKRKSRGAGQAEQIYRKPRTGKTGKQKKRGSQRQEQDIHLLEELQDRITKASNRIGKEKAKTL